MKTLELTRNDLLKMIERHARANDSWMGDDAIYRPSRIEVWADQRVKEMLPRLFAGYNTDETWGALFAILELHHWLSAETADALGYPCVSEGEQIIAWAQESFLDYSGEST